MAQLTVRSRAAAAAFGQRRVRQIVLLLAARERSQRELAAATGTPLNLLHYHLAKLRRLGLVRVVREERRAGRAIKIYRAAAEAFYVPAELMGELPGPPRLKGAVVQPPSAAGVLFFTEEGKPKMQLVGDRGEGALWLELALGEREARALMAELRALFRRHEQTARRGPRRFVVQAALLPRAPRG